MSKTHQLITGGYCDHVQEGGRSSARPFDPPAPHGHGSSLERGWTRSGEFFTTPTFHSGKRQCHFASVTTRTLTESSANESKGLNPYGNSPW
jgi:hypothetical protein